MNVLLTITYDGTDFCGYQVQPNKRTVESELNLALKTVLGKEVKTVASGRTDSGVHALSQKVNFQTDSSIPVEKFPMALNRVLPSDIKVVSAKRVAENFNARYSAKRKTYKYSCYFSQMEEPLKLRYAVCLKYPLDIDKMKEVAKAFEGEHDFKCCLASGSSIKTTVRTVYSVKIQKKGKNLDFFVTGNGFLYNMVRIIVGTLIKAGEGKIDRTQVEKALITGNRELLGKTMPSKGLTLYSVIYK